MFKLEIGRFDRKLPDSRAQGCLGDMPKIFVALHERPQPGGIQLFLPPQPRKRIQIASDAGAAALDYRMDVQQRPISIEDARLWLRRQEVTWERQTRTPISAALFISLDI